MITTVETYRTITGDTDTVDADVETALLKAQATVERKTDRYFEYNDYTESLRTHENGLVYPRGLPLSEVTSPAGATIVGAAVSGAFSGLETPSGYWRLGRPVWRVTVEYSGGYLEDDMPEDIVRAVALVARRELPVRSGSLSNIPVGVTSIHVGDVSMAGASIGTAILPTEVYVILREWRRREL